jgi:hypothetical protein
MPSKRPVPPPDNPYKADDLCSSADGFRFLVMLAIHAVLVGIQFGALTMFCIIFWSRYR